MEESHRVEFKQLNNFRVRFDLYDTMVSVCIPDLLKHYEENFDFHVGNPQAERSPGPRRTALQ
jgi:hypothetical protein